MAAAGSSSAASLSLGSGSGNTGTTVNLPLTYTSAGAQISGLQWKFTYSSTDFSGISVLIGPAGSAASKTVTCNSPAAGQYVCVLVGQNTNVIADGVVATATFTIAGNTTSTSSAIQMPVTYGVAPTGSAVAVTGAGGTVTITTPVLSPTFTSSATASPNPVSQGTTTTVSSTVTCTSNSLTNGIVQLVVLDPTGHTAATQSFAAQSFSANQSHNYSLAFAPTLTGAFTVQVSVSTSSNQVLSLNSSAATITVNPSIKFTSSASASPASFNAGTSTNLTLTVQETGATPVSNAIVQIQVLNSANTLVASHLWTGQSFTSGQQIQQTYTWSTTNSTAAGTYSIAVAVFDSGMSQLYHFNGTAGALTVNPAPTPPASPNGLSASAGTSQVSLAWNGSAGATSYNVYRGTASGGETVIATGLPSTGYTDNTVANGTKYFYVVAAVNATGTSGFSNEASATPQMPAPAAPVVLAAIGGNGQVTVTWTSVNGATSYYVYRGTASLGESPSPIAGPLSTTSYVDTSVTNGIQYFYRVTAANSGGTSGLSNEGSATPQVGAPSAPSALIATGGNGQVSLSWGTSTGAASYSVYRGTAAGGEAPSPVASGLTVPSFADTNVANGTRYYYRVAAVNAGGTSPLSNEASALPQVGAPAAPTNLAAVAGPGRVALTWVASSGATSYSVYRGTAAGSEGSAALASGISATSFSDTTAANGTKYFYTVTATNAGGSSGASNEASATPQVNAPAAPGGLFASAGNTQVSLTWSSSAGATAYLVYRGTASGQESAAPLASVSTPAYVDASVSNGVAYFYRVAASNNGGVSGTSNEASATPQTTTSHTPVPNPPASLTASRNGNLVELAWTASSGADSYNVYRGTATGAESATPIATGVTGTSYTDLSTSTGTQYFYQVSAVNSTGSSSRSNEASTAAPTTGLQFVPVTPCRIFDTRNAEGPFGGPAIAGGSSRDFPVAASPCGIPASAAALSVNTTVVPRGSLAYLTLFPTGESQPFVSTLNSLDGRIKANAAIVPTGTNGSVSVYVTNTADVILDVNGYFTQAGANTLQFYPLSPCRVADTRAPNGALGSPSISSGQSRDIPVAASSCSIPATARAYSLNFTAVPESTLGFLTVWPTGTSMPLVSTLNSPTGTIVANAAIVPAGNGGSISLYATNTTHVVIDVNGYFAPPGAAGGLSFYTVNPCRISDTRNPAGPFGGPIIGAAQSRNYSIPSSPCGVPAAAQAFSLNVTAVPQTALEYLTLWPTGMSQPFVSTLNALDASITANAAIVPGNSFGSISVYATNSTDVVLDINGYFAP